VGMGIEYQEFTLPDPNRLFVARMDRDNTACFVDTMLAQGRLSVNETIGAQATRYGDAINYWDQDWGQRNNIIVAINGDFPDTSDNTPLMGMTMTGWYVKDITAASRRFYETMVPDVAIGYGSTAGRTLHYLSSGTTQAIEGVNVTRGSNELIVYGPQYNNTTPAATTGVEVLVEMTRPTLTLPGGDPAVGIIKQIRQNVGSTPIPFDHVVLSASDGRATTLLANAHVGDRVGISFNISGAPMDFTRTYATLGCGETFLGNGEVWGRAGHQKPPHGHRHQRQVSVLRGV
jgi:hypothetical protein